MDLTEGTQEEKQNRSKKMMLWFGIGSLIMTFAGLISAFIVSRKREDWLLDFQLPNAFIVSVVLIVISSVTLIFAKRALEKNNMSQVTIGLLLTFALGVAFIYNQFAGFGQIIESGYNFTGPTSNVTISFIYIIAVVHILHVVGGLIALIVVIYKHFKQRYNSTNMLGFELASNFWHFIDILWVVLFLFLYFFRYII